MKLNVQIQMPSFPNFLRLSGNPSKGTIDLGGLSDDAYAEFEEQYMEALRKHWLARKAKLNKTG